MPVFKVEIVKAAVAGFEADSWRNVYHLNAASVGDASALADNLVNAETAIMSEDFAIVQKRVSDPAKVEPTLTTNLTGVQGDQVYAGGTLPLWNVCVVNFRDASGGRQERKYYRLGFGEGAVDGNVLTTTTLDLIQAVIDELVSITIALCSPSGDTIVEGVVDSRVGMRQLHWHRRKRPGFHRGYVPD